MNILMIPTWYSAHDAEVMIAGVFHYEQSIALKKYADVAIYFPYDTSLDVGFYKGMEKGLLTYRRGKRIPFINPLLYVLDFIKICKEFKPDIIHGHVASGGGFIASLLGGLFRIPVVITEHCPIEMMNFKSTSFMKRVEQVYKRSFANICVSNDLSKRLQEYFKDAKFETIYNGVIDPLKAQKDGNKYAIEGVINCCIVASFYSKDIKGYQFLLPAMKELVKQEEKIVLHICGGGEYLEYYQQMAQELCISDNCIFYGNCDKEKVYSVLEQMDFGISASLFESAGVSIQEALLLGKPVLVTKSGGGNSLVTEQVAVIVDKGSASAIEYGMKKIISQLDLYDSRTIRNYAIQRFEMDEVCKQYMELYNSIENK